MTGAPNKLNPNPKPQGIPNFGQILAAQRFLGIGPRFLATGLADSLRPAAYGPGFPSASGFGILGLRIISDAFD